MPNVLITGGAKRIGAQMSRAFARAGFNVVIHHNTSAAEAEALQQELNHEHVCCWLVQGDISESGRVREVFHQARQAVGAFDLCINNASLFVNDDIESIEDAQFDAHMNVNLKAPVVFAQLMYEQVEPAEDRLIINLLDNKVFAINPDFLTYTLSKSALLTATEMLAMRFGGFPRVCGIAPSITLVSGEQTQDDFDRTSRINPLKRKVFPSDLSDAALFMWRTRSYNRQVITVDCGQTLLELPRDVAFYKPEEALDERV